MSTTWSRRVVLSAGLAGIVSFASFFHPEGHKVYSGGNWSALSVFDAETLDPLGKVDLGHSQVGVGLRFIEREEGF